MTVANELLTTQEVAKLLGVGTTSVKRWTDSGLLRCVKTPGGHRRFPRDAVETFMASSLQSGSMLAKVETPDRARMWVHRLVHGISEQGMAQALSSELREYGTWSLVAESMHPVIEELGKAWVRGEISVVQEHIASERLARAIARCSESTVVPEDAPTAMLMAAEDEEHTLGLNLVELCLREGGWGATWIGRKTPVHCACDFILSSDIKLVAVSASAYAYDAASLADQAERLGVACHRRAIPLLLGGTGMWPERPHYGHRLRTFTELRELLASLSPSRGAA